MVASCRQYLDKYARHKQVVKWQQHVSTPYPKSPLQSEGKWLLGYPRTNGLVVRIKYLIPLCILSDKRYLTVKGRKILPKDVIGS
jgi:hypothetical protein